jgi:HTH-type transcriptional regulator/antitoxin HigA
MSRIYTLTPIRCDADHKAALKLAEAYFDAPQEPDPDSPEGAHFEALITLIEAYEAKSSAGRNEFKPPARQ